MDVKEINILGEQVNTHWYYVSKAKAVLALLHENEVKNILDVGAGSGFFSKYILEHKEAQEIYCVDTAYEQDSEDTFLGKSVYYKKNVQQSNADTVLLMDILEHVDNDVAVLSEYVEKAPVGATFLISVPAFQFLWSEHDIFLEHKRRYTLAEIEKVVEKTGLKIEKSCYFFGAIFPLVASIRLFNKILLKYTKYIEPKSQLKPSHPLVNRILQMALSCEIPLMSYNKLAGVTAFCMARKI